MDKLWIIVGKTCSGKTSIVKELVNRGYEQIVTCTTRPIREGEVEDVTYHYLSDEEFQKGIKNGDFIEYTSYNVASGETWYYGTRKSDLVPGKIIILNPAGLKTLKNSCVDFPYSVIYINSSDDVIRRRLTERGDNPDEARRRIQADMSDFANIYALANYTITNNDNVSIKRLAGTVEKIIKMEGVYKYGGFN